MKTAIKLAAACLAAASFAGCGKVIAGLAKGAAHEADNVVVAGARSAADDEAKIALSAAGHSTDDAFHGPKPAEETLHETPVTNFVLDRGKDVAEEAFTNGIENASSDKDDDR